jgi:hypothetical protein
VRGHTLSTCNTWSSIILIFIHLVTVGSGASLLPVVGFFKGDFVKVGLLGELGHAVSGG